MASATDDTDGAEFLGDEHEFQVLASRAEGGLEGGLNGISCADSSETLASNGEVGAIFKTVAEAEPPRRRDRCDEAGDGDEVTEGLCP